LIAKLLFQEKISNLVCIPNFETNSKPKKQLKTVFSEGEGRVLFTIEITALKAILQQRGFKAPQNSG
jgi:hypothetical protein